MTMISDIKPRLCIRTLWWTYFAALSSCNRFSNAESGLKIRWRLQLTMLFWKIKNP